jgi:hypothetical protein
MSTEKPDQKFEVEARALFLKINKEKKLKWKRIGELINKYIKSLDIKNVEPNTGLRGWETVFRSNGGRNADELFWKDLATIGKAILAEIESTAEQAEIFTGGSFEAGSANGKPFIYTLAILQDTILPLLHKPAIMRMNHVTFDEQRHWSECLDALIDEKVDVALHNFPTALAYMSNPDASGDIFFWPFFVFFGYALFVRRESLRRYCTKHNLPYDTYAAFRQNSKDVIGGFFRSCEIVVERHTDTEYALKDYITRNGARWEDINLKDLPINEGKQQFKESGVGDILCTNSLHVLDLERLSDKFELIDKGENVTRHNNYNGLICTMDYYHNRPDLIKGLITSWFECMKDTVEEWDLIKSSNEIKKNDINNFYHQSLLNYLQDRTFSDEIPLDKFIKSFTNNNRFFSDGHKAYHSLTGMMNTPKEIERNWEIADMQNKGNRWDNHKLVEDKILKNMQEIKKHILK